MKTCFVIQGFNKKQDFATGRVLDLDASYEVIREAVLEAGLECVRADEIRHSGTIDKPMFEQILAADLVVADLSTSNLNAAYELGVRHALRPYATIVVAESQFKYPFDFSHIAIQKYVHMGDDVGRREAARFKAALVELIRELVRAGAVDSPVYDFLKPLTPPVRGAGSMAGPARIATAFAAQDDSVKERVDRAKAALGRDAFAEARDELLALRREILGARSEPGTPIGDDATITQMLALATYKGKQPTEEAALDEARGYLEELAPADSLDTETLGLWGAVHKRLWDIRHEPALLDEAIRSYGRGFELKRDYYNGVNYAFVLNLRAKHRADVDPAEAVADFVLALRARRDVERICRRLLEALPEAKADTPPDVATRLRWERYWVLATLRETAVALGDPAAAAGWERQAAPYADAPWMIRSTEDQIARLAPLLADPPTSRVR